MLRPHFHEQLYNRWSSLPTTLPPACGKRLKPVESSSILAPLLPFCSYAASSSHSLPAADNNLLSHPVLGLCGVKARGQQPNRCRIVFDVFQTFSPVVKLSGGWTGGWEYDKWTAPLSLFANSTKLQISRNWHCAKSLPLQLTAS